MIHGLWKISWSVALDAIHGAPLSHQQVLCSKHYYHFWMNLALRLGILVNHGCYVHDGLQYVGENWHSRLCEYLSCIAYHGDASNLQYHWFWSLNENYGCGWRTMATVELFSHATFCCSVTITRASDETRDALLKRVKQCFGLCRWTKFVWCLYLLPMTTNIASSLTDASTWITPSFWIGNDLWWSWILQKQPSRIFASTEYTQKTWSPNRSDPQSKRIRNMCELIPFQARAKAASFLSVSIA